MGTRHLVAVVMDDQFKVAQYGQWDGYPSGQGETVRAFLSQEGFDLARFREKLSNAYFITDEEGKAFDAELKRTGKDLSELYPSLSRDAGAGILQMIYDSEDRVPLTDSSSFAADSLFCEWGYVIDLDKNMLEIYQGFNQTPVAEGERFHGMWDSDNDRRAPGEAYHPIRLLVGIPLGDVATFDMSEVERADEEEDDDDSVAVA